MALIQFPGEILFQNTNVSARNKVGGFGGYKQFLQTQNFEKLPSTDRPSTKILSYPVIAPCLKTDNGISGAANFQPLATSDYWG